MAVWPMKTRFDRSSLWIQRLGEFGLLTAIPNDCSPKDGLKEIIQSGLSYCPEVRKLPSNAGDVGSIPTLGGFHLAWVN